MQIRFATIDDIEQLVTLRIDYFLSENLISSEEEKRILASRSRDYFARHFPQGDFLAVLAEENGRIVSTAFLLIADRPTGPAFPSGLIGTVMNVLTYPEFRRRGIATEVLRALIAGARELGVSSLDLTATEAGRPLYERLGFALLPYAPMRLSLANG